MQSQRIGNTAARVLHIFRRHRWVFKGFAAPNGSCAWVWHCQLCRTSSVKYPFDDPIRFSGYVPSFLEWEAASDNSVGAHSGRGVYVIQDNRMKKKGLVDAI